MKKLKTLSTTLALLGIFNLAHAQDKHVHLHVNPRWEECSFQLDPSLTQAAWKEFTKEAGLVAYFRPLTDAKPLGPLHFEVALLQWQTKFDDTKPAWNDTFVHPDSTHWLKESDRLPFPGFTARMGITEKMDVGVYITKSPGANYGFYGGQVQYNFLNDPEKKWSASGRVSFTSMYGPEDLKLSVYGIDGLVSREFPLFARWASVAPYVGISQYLSWSRETSAVVDLDDERAVGGQAMVGAVLKLSAARIGIEYNIARVNTVSFKIGAAF